MKRENEHDANRGLTDGKRSKFRPPAPRNVLPAKVVLGWVLAFVAAVVFLTPAIKELLR